MRILRYEVPVDDQVHEHALSGAVVHVDCRRRDVVEFWALDSGGPQVPRRFLVVGTGHPWPTGSWVHVGSALATPFVWHLLEDRA